MERTFRGIGVSPGIAIGPARPFGVQTLDVPRYTAPDKAAEMKRFLAAVEAARQELEVLRERTQQELGPAHGEIFKAHMMVLDDMALHQEIKDRLEQEGLNVEFLLNDIVARYSKVLRSIGDAHFQERTKDLLDVSKRILGKLLNAEMESLERLDHPCVIVAHDLSPSDTAKLDIVNALGVVTDVGGPASHTAILARAFELPAVVALHDLGASVSPGDTVIVDGAHGYVIIRPNESTLSEYVAKKKRDEEARKELLAEKDRPSVTLDGESVPILANIELPVEISHSLKANAQGVGLYRTEYLFLNRTALPTEEEQFQAFAEVASAMKPAPVTLRTLDLGGDKFVSHLRLAEEINPQLGWRAIRFCLARPDIFKAHLRAMFRASVYGNIQIMFPLVTGVDELLRVKDVVREVCADLERCAVPFDKNVKIGSMIEVPSAVLVADRLAQECDFFSIGTNDLIQYSLAVDRANDKIAHLYEPAHPAVLRMIRQTTAAARAAHIPCGICGEMAGSPVFTELLIGLGVDSLSMSAVSIPVVRAQVVNTRMSVAKRFARRLLALSSSAEIKAQLYRRFKGRRALEAYLSQFEPRDDAPAETGFKD